MKFVDYKCNECGYITEIVIKNNEKSDIRCSKCGSKDMSRVFSSPGVKCSKDSGGGSCSSGSCSTCSGCS